MNLRLQPITDFGLAETAVLLTDSFANYHVPIHFDLPGLLQMLISTHVSLQQSRVLLADGSGVGVGLIARRGWHSRLAAMGVLPAFRGRGMGTWLLQQLLQAARADGTRRMELEVITANEAACALYMGGGFRIRRELHSWQRAAAAGASAAAAPVEIDIPEFAQAVQTHGLPDLPWQLSAPSVIHSAPPARAFQLGEARVLISDPLAAQIRIAGLVVPGPARGRGEGRRLLQALFARYAQKTWQIPALCPAETAGFWQKMGFQQGTISQYQMEIELPPLAG